MAETSASLPRNEAAPTSLHRGQAGKSEHLFPCTPWHPQKDLMASQGAAVPLLRTPHLNQYSEQVHIWRWDPIKPLNLIYLFEYAKPQKVLCLCQYWINRAHDYIKTMVSYVLMRRGGGWKIDLLSGSCESNGKYSWNYQKQMQSRRFLGQRDGKTDPQFLLFWNISNKIKTKTIP